jgi:tetratricopeptide (TPR) repeat protein
MLGNSREALEAAEKVSKYNEISALRIEAEVYCNLLKNYEKSVQLFEELTKKDPDHFNYKHRYAYALWQIGKYDSANILFEMQVKEFKKELALGRVERNDPHYNLAGIFAFLNKADSAIIHLRQHKFTSGLEIYVERDPLFRNLHGTKDFEQVIWQAKNEKASLRKKINRTTTAE